MKAFCPPSKRESFTSTKEEVAAIQLLSKKESATGRRWVRLARLTPGLPVTPGLMFAVGRRDVLEGGGGQQALTAAMAKRPAALCKQERRGPEDVERLLVRPEPDSAPLKQQQQQQQQRRQQQQQQPRREVEAEVRVVWDKEADRGKKKKMMIEEKKKTICKRRKAVHMVTAKFLRDRAWEKSLTSVAKRKKTKKTAAVSKTKDRKREDGQMDIKVMLSKQQ